MEILTLQRGLFTVREEPLSSSDLELLPVHLPFFEIGEAVVWRDESARIVSPAFIFEEAYHYDLRLVSTGQMILGVCEEELLSLSSVAADEAPDLSPSVPSFAEVIEIPDSVLRPLFRDRIPPKR